MLDSSAAVEDEMSHLNNMWRELFGFWINCYISHRVISHRSVRCTYRLCGQSHSGKGLGTYHSHTHLVVFSVFLDSLVTWACLMSQVLASAFVFMWLWVPWTECIIFHLKLHYFEKLTYGRGVDAVNVHAELGTFCHWGGPWQLPASTRWLIEHLLKFDWFYPCHKLQRWAEISASLTNWMIPATSSKYFYTWVPALCWTSFPPWCPCCICCV